MDEQKEVFILYSNFYQHGNLSNMLHSHEKSKEYCRTWKQKYEWIVSCCQALEYLHSKQVMHKDVKPDNYLIKDLNECIVHICDFGINKMKTVSTTFTTTHSHSMASTLQYKAPELYSTKFKNVSDKQDIYSLGVVMWEICHLQKLFDGYDAVSIIGTLINEEYPLKFDENVPIVLQELMQMCLKKKPEERPSAMEILSYLQKHKLQIISTQ